MKKLFLSIVFLTACFPALAQQQPSKQPSSNPATTSASASNKTTTSTGSTAPAPSTVDKIAAPTADDALAISKLQRDINQLGLQLDQLSKYYAQIQAAQTAKQSQLSDLIVQANKGCTPKKFDEVTLSCVAPSGPVPATAGSDQAATPAKKVN